MHTTVDLKVLYFGTPVVLISTRNADGTANLAPMSSAWWLGDYEPDKFGAAGLTPRPADLVAVPVVAECPIQLECELVSAEPFNYGSSTAHTVRVVRSHADEQLIVPGTQHIDPLRWDPLIMKFCEFFGGGVQLRPSRLAEAWQIPQKI
jgi:flavin reductase (DIM6/NTAB) family NADH-FMN oxidoreductase RutF